MAKKHLTKAQCRKRLLEASEKIWKVLGSYSPGLSPRDDTELQKARLTLIKMANRLK